jgi:hypothetical protein
VQSNILGNGDSVLGAVEESTRITLSGHLLLEHWRWKAKPYVQLDRPCSSILEDWRLLIIGMSKRHDSGLILHPQDPLQCDLLSRVGIFEVGKFLPPLKPSVKHRSNSKQVRVIEFEKMERQLDAGMALKGMEITLV